jgi:hypothetical protein
MGMLKAVGWWEQRLKAAPPDQQLPYKRKLVAPPVADHASPQRRLNSNGWIAASGLSFQDRLYCLFCAHEPSLSLWYLYRQQYIGLWSSRKLPMAKIRDWQGGCTCPSSSHKRKNRPSAA